jgi:hypothetical protein
MRICNDSSVPPQYTMNNVPLKVVHESKVLGVVIDSTLSFKTECANRAAKASRIAGCVARTFKNKNTGTLLQAFNSYVQPHLDYCSSIWSGSGRCSVTNNTVIERVQRRYTKRILGYPETSYEDRLLELGIVTQAKRRICHDLSIMHSMYNRKSNLDFKNFFRLKNDVQSSILSFPVHHVFKEHSRINTSLNSFTHRITDIWNSMPEEIVTRRNHIPMHSWLTLYEKSIA